MEQVNQLFNEYELSSDEEEPMEIAGEDDQIILDMPPIQVPPLPPPAVNVEHHGIQDDDIGQYFD